MAVRGTSRQRVATNLQLEGDFELVAALQGLKENVQRRVLRTAATKAGRILRTEAKRKAPRDSGALRRSMTMNVKTYADSGAVVAVVGPGYRHGEIVQRSMWPVDTIRNRVVVQTRTVGALPRKYAHLVEYGTKPHRIGRGGTKGVQHPGTRGTLFLTRAFNGKRSEMESLWRREVAAGIEREASKARRR